MEVVGLIWGGDKRIKGWRERHQTKQLEGGRRDG